jgi:hypothetical protein
MELSVENRPEGVAVGCSPIGVTRKRARGQVNVMNQPFLEIPDVCPRPLKGHYYFDHLGIVGRGRRFRKPVEAGFEGDLSAGLCQG